MTRTLSVVATIVLAALAFVQLSRVAVRPVAGVSSTSVATAVAGDPPAVDATAEAIEDLAAWPVAAGR
jgi:hypothetical protein